MTGPLNSPRSQTTGPLHSSKKIAETNNVQASVHAFSEQLALRVAALVREVAAGHEASLRRQLLLERDMISKLCSKHSTLGNADPQDGNFVASEVPRPDATRNNVAIPKLRLESNKVASGGGVDAAYSVGANGHQQYFDVPRLQQVERAFETPRVPVEIAEQTSPRDALSSACSGSIGGSDKTLAARNSERPSLARGLSLPSISPSSARSGRTGETSLPAMRKSDSPSLARSMSDASLLATPVFGSQEGEMMKELVQTRFKELDWRRAGQLNAENLRSCVQSLDGEEVAAFDCRIADAIEAYNKANTRFQPKSKNLRELTFDGFFHMMIADSLENDLSPEQAAILTDIKTVCVNEAALKIIATKAMVSTNDITGERRKNSFCNRMMEPVSGFVICINALCIGLQLDIAEEWMGWQIMELFFTCFFIFELALKLRKSGCLEMFFGEDWRWSLFDTLIVGMATLDLCFWLGKILGLEEGPSLRNFSIMRLSRLMRITRVVRLLKLHFFKDLTVMINGVFGGLKTLFWAFVLLLCIIYVVGVMLRQVVVTARIDCANSVCTTALKHLEEFEPQLFANCFRSMFTVFRCLTDGCSSADGTPLVLYFWDAHGPLFVVIYIFVIIFILFGVFNLISAIFVEKTLEYAKLDTAKRREARYKEEVRIAKEFRALVVKICSHQLGFSQRTSHRRTTGQRNMDSFMSGFKFAVGGGNCLNHDGHLDIESSRPPSGCQLTINRENFDLIMNDEDIRARMEDLEISVTSSAKLFDILDSNGSGSVDVVELTEGLMSLRGPADKGDIISGSLLVKSTQKMVKDMHDEMTKCMQKQNRQLELLQQLDAKVKSCMPTESGLRFFR